MSHHVLIIEDSLTILNVTAHKLRQEGITCTLAESAEQGLEILEQAKTNGLFLDAVLVDLQLPGMSGSDFIDLMINNNAYAHLAVMIFTERPDAKALKLAMSYDRIEIHLKSEQELLAYRLISFIHQADLVRSLNSKGSEDRFNKPAENQRILFVDDSPTIRAKYAQLLQSEGFIVDIASGMDSALVSAKRNPPNLAIIDFYMPDGNGDELTKALLANPHTKDITVVIFSQSKDVLQQSLAAGAIDLIYKDDLDSIFLMRVNSIEKSLTRKQQAFELSLFHQANEALGIGVIVQQEHSPAKPMNSVMKNIIKASGNLDLFLEQPMVDEISVKLSSGKLGIYSLTRLNAGKQSITLVQNITELASQRQSLIEAKEVAEAAGSAKTQFLSTMSHEIRTPMNGVLGMLQLLEDTQLSVEQQDYVESINRSGQGLLAIINDILDFSKLDAGMVVLESIEFDLELLTLECLELLSTKAVEKNIELVLDFQPNLPRKFLGDPSRLRQILINLIGNAVKFTESGYVRLSVSKQLNQEICLEVKDTGIGLSKEVITTLFDKFTQADQSTTREFGGTGLGLSISQNLVNLMGGEIRVTSELAKGSSFQFSLSLTESQTNKSSSDLSKKNQPSASLNELAIVIVDDGSENIRCLENNLNFIGVSLLLLVKPTQLEHTVVQAQATGKAFDIAIVPNQLVNLDNKQQYLASATSIRLLLLASSGKKGDVQLFKDAGFHAYLNRLCQQEILAKLLITLADHPIETEQELLTQHSVKTTLSKQTANKTSLSGKVLLVEDIAINQRIAAHLLKKIGIEVDIANNGQIGYEMWHQGNYDLIFMDCLMPVMDGYEATRLIRQQEKLANVENPIAIVALTANATVEDRHVCEAAGMNFVITKPIVYQELVNCLQQRLPSRIELPC